MNFAVGPLCDQTNSGEAIPRDYQIPNSQWIDEKKQQRKCAATPFSSQLVKSLSSNKLILTVAVDRVWTVDNDGIVRHDRAEIMK